MKNKMLFVGALALATLVGCGPKDVNTPDTSSTKVVDPITVSETTGSTSQVESIISAGTSETTESTSQVESIISVGTSETISSVVSVGTSEDDAVAAYNKAVQDCEALADNAASDDKVTLTGYIKEVTYVNTKYSSITFWFAATADGDAKLQVYSAALPEGVKAETSLKESLKGKKVTVTGYLKKYVKSGSTTLEIADKDKVFPVITSLE